MFPLDNYRAGTKRFRMINEVESAFVIVETWLAKKGFSLFRSKQKSIVDEVDFERKVVFISQRYKINYQFYSLLHECGHIILRSRKNYETLFKANIDSEGSNRKQSYRACVEEVEEEILAWREGYNLANKLKIYVDQDKYHTYGSRWVMTYIVKAALGKEHLFLPTENKIESEKNEKENLKTEQDTPIQLELDIVPEPCYNEE